MGNKSLPNETIGSKKPVLSLRIPLLFCIKEFLFAILILYYTF
jgi:hypothetical protein